MQSMCPNLVWSVKTSQSIFSCYLETCIFSQVFHDVSKNNNNNNIIKKYLTTINSLSLISVKRKSILKYCKILRKIGPAHWVFTCSKLTIETLEQGVIYVQS